MFNDFDNYLIGAGGQEAALFSKEMLDMYQR
jgi:protein subunit release factor A